MELRSHANKGQYFMALSHFVGKKIDPKAEMMNIRKQNTLRNVPAPNVRKNVMTTRSRAALADVENRNVRTTKRKAEGSPTKESRVNVKRSALSDLPRNSNIVPKKNGVEKPILKAVVTRAKQTSIKTVTKPKNNENVVAPNAPGVKTKTRLPVKTTTDTEIVVKSKVPLKESISKVKRLSNEFEKTEESMYATPAEELLESSATSIYKSAEALHCIPTVKPVEVKPVEVKPIEVKPIDVKPVEVKLIEVKLIEVKPMEVKPMEVKPIEVKPLEVKPLEVKPLEVKPVEVETEELKPEVKPSNVSLVATQFKEQLNLGNHEVPEGVDDFDKENLHDVNQSSEYAMDIFNYLKEREDHQQIRDYMAEQSCISIWMRSLLVDWMVEIQESFELNHETLYLGVKLVDLYLSRVTVGKDVLQLVGASAMFVASKYDERIPPLIDDFLYICDGAYCRRELIQMEMNLLKVCDFDLGISISYRFLRRYARCAKVTMPILTLARFILEMSLMNYEVVTVKESKLAAASLYMSLKMKEVSGWTPALEFYTGYKIEDIISTVYLLNNDMNKPKAQLKTIRNKYNHKLFFEVAKTPIISNEQLKP